jgi:hypothetical protein
MVQKIFCTKWFRKKYAVKNAKKTRPNHGEARREQIKVALQHAMTS